MAGRTLKKELSALEDAAQTDPSALSARVLQRLQNTPSAPLVPLLQEISVLYRLNQLVLRLFTSLQTVDKLKELKLLGAKVLSLLKLLSQQKKQLPSGLSSVPPQKSISLLQFIPFARRASVWKASISISDPDLLTTSPVSHFLYRLHEAYFPKSVAPALKIPPFLVVFFQLLIESGFPVSLVMRPLVQRLREIPSDSEP